MNSAIFRNYDIRGIYGSEVTDEIAYKIGYFFGERSNREVIVGYDGRLAVQPVFKAFVEGVLDAGGSIISIGLVPTQLLYYANVILKPGSAIMITASHNPKEYIGFKMILDGEPFCGDRIVSLKEYVMDSSIAYKPKELFRIEEKDLSDLYLERIFEGIHIDPNLKIAWDIGNGAVGSIIDKLISKMPNENIIWNKEVDGNFPVRSPDPTDHDNLSIFVENIMMDDFDLGIAFDGDGDRVVFITSEGDILEGDEALLIFAKDILKENPHATIISEVKASRAFFNEIEKLGGRAIMAKTGHSNIKQAIKEEKANLAGELSCHFFFPDKYFIFDDATYAALRMIDIITRYGQSLHKLYLEIPKLYSSPEIKIEVGEERKSDIVSALKENLRKEGRKFIDIDGVRYEKKEGWWLVRISNTSPAISIRMEGESEKALNNIKIDLQNHLKRFDISVTF